MPAYLFGPACNQLSSPYSWKKLHQLADEFQVSPLAAAVRLIDEVEEPLVLACYDVRGRRWFKRTAAATSLFPPDESDARSGVIDALLGQRRPGPCLLAPAVWFPSGRLQAKINEDIHVWEDIAYVLLQPQRQGG